MAFLDGEGPLSSIPAPPYPKHHLVTPALLWQYCPIGTLSLPHHISACAGFRAALFLSLSITKNKLALARDQGCWILCKTTEILWHFLHGMHCSQRHQLQVLPLPRSWGWHGESKVSAQQHPLPIQFPSAVPLLFLMLEKINTVFSSSSGGRVRAIRSTHKALFLICSPSSP